MKLGTEDRKKTIWAIVLGVLAVLIVAYEFMPSSSSPSPVSAANPLTSTTTAGRPAARRVPGVAKKIHADNLDPTLKLDLLAATEQTKYAGSGRNIFVSQAEVAIPKVGSAPNTDTAKTYTTPSPPPPTPINLKFFGFANTPGEPKQIFLSQGDDVFIAAEGDIVNRRYKVMRISATSVEVQDVLGSGPPQNIPLTQG